MKYEGKTGEYFEIARLSKENVSSISSIAEHTLALIWFEENDNVIVIDSVEQRFDKNQIIFLTSFHHIEIKSISQAKVLLFNKPFFCVVNHDSEVGCKGILFYGATSLPVISIKDQELATLDTVWKMLCLEMESADELQLEMLQMMLKRVLILCTRIYKNQENYTAVDDGQVNIIREFNYLVEQHFRSKHSVAEYAELLFKSPKTLSNLFHQLGSKTPLEFIQERILLEAKRLLSYTNQSVSEVAFSIGYDDVQSFSRFFKKKTSLSPSEYKSDQIA